MPRYNPDKTMGKAAKAAETDAAEVIAAVRNASAAAPMEPIVWLTSNAYFPPLREVGQADVFYSGSFWNPSDSWVAYAETFTEAVEAAEIYLGSPEDDNCLYAVDLRLWQFREDAEDAETYSEEWEARQPCDHCQGAALPRQPETDARYPVACERCKVPTVEAFAFPGGYPIGYLVDDGEYLCAACVNDPSNPVHRGGNADGWRLEGSQVLEGGADDYDGPILCAHCGKVLVGDDD